MKILAFNLEADDPWEILGLPKFEGPVPTRAMAENRVRDGRLLLAMANSSWPAADRKAEAGLP